MLGLTSTGLILIDASSPQRNWNYQTSEDEIQDGETLRATLTPFREMVAVSVISVSDGSVRDDGWHYTVGWLLALRDGSTIEIAGTRRTRADIDALVSGLLVALT